MPTCSGDHGADGRGREADVLIPLHAMRWDVDRFLAMVMPLGVISLSWGVGCVAFCKVMDLLGEILYSSSSDGRRWCPRCRVLLEGVTLEVRWLDFHYLRRSLSFER